MTPVLVGQANLQECQKCEGLWCDAASLEAICADRQEQTSVLGMAAAVSPPPSICLEANVRYVPCPICRKLMNRVNFASCSNVVVDVCKQHGTWFDKDELRRIVEFIRSGGFEKARAREIEELDQRQRQRQLNVIQIGSPLDPGDESPSNTPGWEIGLSAAAAVLKVLLR